MPAPYPCARQKRWTAATQYAAKDQPFQPCTAKLQAVPLEWYGVNDETWML